MMESTGDDGGIEVELKGSYFRVLPLSYVVQKTWCVRGSTHNID